jgi:hypothetical protein
MSTKRHVRRSAQGRCRPSATIQPSVYELRRRIEAAAEALIALLDQLDASTEDLEPDADWEPWLAAPEDHPCQLHWCRGCDDDREHEDRPVPQVRRP